MSRMLLRLPLFAAALSVFPLTTSAADAASALSAAVADVQAIAPASAPARLRLIDTSFNILLAVGGSTADDDLLQTLQGGGHDPKARGFNFQSGEFSLAGAVDPYFTAQAHVLLGPDHVELEEAYAVSSALPYGLQAKAGFFLAEFGRINPSHPHSWGWVDQPIINTRVFGPEGLRGPGARLSWMLPLPVHVEASGTLMQSDGAFAGSFLGPWHGAGHAHSHGHGGHEEEGGSEHIEFYYEDEGSGDEYEMEVENYTTADLGYNGWPTRDRHPYHTPMLGMARLATAFAPVDNVELKLGASWAEGLNALGGYTHLYGADVVAKWTAKSAKRGYPFVKLEAEWVDKHVSAPGYSVHAVGVSVAGGTELELHYDVAAARFQDYGYNAMLTLGLVKGWDLGVRFEQVSGLGDGVHELHEGPEADSRWEDALRQDRCRVSPVLTYWPSEFSRLRLQYNHDVRAVKQGETVAHTVWFSTEFLFGAHPAHKF